MGGRRRAAAGGLLALLLLLACAATGGGQQQQQHQQHRRRTRKDGDVIILTDENFDRETATGVWMINIFAHGCVHCQHLAPTWKMFATEMKEHGIKVAKVDGPDNRVLSKRFPVIGWPSIFLLRTGQTWQYNGPRNIPDLKSFALRDYQRAPQLPWHKSPNSMAGRMLGTLYSFPTLAKLSYEFLREDVGLSDPTIIAGVLLIPLAVGALFICVLDALYTRQPDFEDERQHYD